MTATVATYPPWSARTTVALRIEKSNSPWVTEFNALPPEARRVR